MASLDTFESNVSDPSGLPFDTSADGPHSANPEWYRQFIDWELLHDLMGGTQAMQLAGQRWLPREDREEESVYNIRLRRGVLFNGYRDAIANLTSKPFGREVETDGFGEQFEPMFLNTDGRGTTLTNTGKRAMTYGAIHGYYFHLVDFTDTSAAKNRLDQSRLRPRPIIRTLCAPQLHAWSWEDNPNGEQRLSMIRFRETSIATVPGSTFRLMRRVFIREIRETGEWTLWEAKDLSDQYNPYDEAIDYWLTGSSYGQAWDHESWEEIDGGRMRWPDGMGGIPIVPVFFDQSGPMTGRPIYRDLAEQNLVHWRASCDHGQLMRFVRVIQGYAAGIQDEGDKILNALGNQRMYRMSDPNARIAMVESGGTAQPASQADLSAIEERMERMGAAPLLRRRAEATATGAAINHSDGYTDAVAFAMAVERGLKEAIRLAHLWTGQEMPEDAKIDVYKDFASPISGADDMKVIAGMVERGTLSRAAEFREAKRRMIVSQAERFDEVQEEAGEESLASIARTPAGFGPQPPAAPERPDPERAATNPEDATGVTDGGEAG